ncbi:hypothetical protein Ddc_17245 [Ditylenchus destructor]|nr:hypothetical protein Ddc_17245 [Ditylenchus destructor]
MSQNSEAVAIKRNIWNQLGLDTQLDVFQCLRAYDLYKNGRFASRQWYDVIERHKEMLPKIRKIPHWRAQNRLSGDSNEEIWRQRVEHRKIREKRIKNYALLCIISSIAAIAAQTISIERTSAMFLLLAVSLRMSNAYTKFWDDPYRLTYDNDGYSIYDGQYYIKICYKRYSTDKLDFLRYVWLGYLGTRSIIFVIIGILRHIVQVDNIFDALLWILHFPEAGYLMNWCFNVCAVCIDCFFMGFRYRYQWKIQWLKPDHARDPRNDYHKIRFIPTYFSEIFQSLPLIDQNLVSMDIASREKLMSQNSEPIAIKRNIWNQLGLDTQLDVFQYLRAYDLYRNGRFASRQWYNVIEQHRGMLPKFRKLRDCSEQNRVGFLDFRKIHNF